MTHTRSDELMRRARKCIAGGVNSPVRAFKSVGGHPPFIHSGDGAFLWDVDGNRYIDLVGSWGPMLFGHRPDQVVATLYDQLQCGSSFGAPTEMEILLAETIQSFVPSMELLRLTSSGTEACMSAIRIARGFTGRSKVVKFEGCYHGHADHLLAKAGSGVATLGLPDSAGVPESITSDTLTLPYNDAEALTNLFASQGGEIACVIVEPVAGNMGCIPPAPGFLQALRELTTVDGSLLIFDEVMTGFRVAKGGAQELFGITPDLTCLGKIVGGGLPLAVYGGRSEIMECVAPLGPVYQAGTLSGNPMAVSAGFATLKMIEADPKVYVRLEVRGALLAEELRRAAKEAAVKATVNQVGSMLTLYFAEQAPSDYATAKRSDTEKFATFFRKMLASGVYLPPSQFEAWFLSDCIGDEEIRAIVGAAREALRAAA